MLFPYVKEEHFRIEPFKTGADILSERRNNPNLILIKLNQEKRIKSNFNKKIITMIKKRKTKKLKKMKIKR